MDRRRGAGLAMALAALSAAAAARADEVAPMPPGSSPAPSWALGGQVTGILQWHPALHAPYSNPDVSFGPGAAWGPTLSVSILAGATPWPGGLVVVMPEFATGRGMPNPSGVAGYPNGDIIKIPALGHEPYVARAFVQQVVRLGGAAAEPADRAEGEAAFMPGGDAQLYRPRPPTRLELTAGKLALTDLFDVADASSDPRHRFMAWSLMNQGAWDYAADTRGFTWGAVAALETPAAALRAALALMPTSANGPTLDWDPTRSRAYVVEAEVRWGAAGGAGSAKLLGYRNTARMGSYRQALDAAAPGTAPDVVATRRDGAQKQGAGLLVQQALGGAGSAFLRAGFDDGATETFAFTEIDRSVSAGLALDGARWGRPGDLAGAGVAASGLSPVHAEYLAAGGRGFQLGDGALRYAWEVVGEAWYAVRLLAGVVLTADVQGIANPGMNADRGPALVVGARLHLHR